MESNRDKIDLPIKWFVPVLVTVIGSSMIAAITLLLTLDKRTTVMQNQITAHATEINKINTKVILIEHQVNTITTEQARREGRVYRDVR